MPASLDSSNRALSPAAVSQKVAPSSGDVEGAAGGQLAPEAGLEVGGKVDGGDVGDHPVGAVVGVDEGAHVAALADAEVDGVGREAEPVGADAGAVAGALDVGGVHLGQQGVAGLAQRDGVEVGRDGAGRPAGSAGSSGTGRGRGRCGRWRRLRAMAGVARNATRQRGLDVLRRTLGEVGRLDGGPEPDGMPVTSAFTTRTSSRLTFESSKSVRSMVRSVVTTTLSTGAFSS